jgi:hypothetical protein
MKKIQTVSLMLLLSLFWIGTASAQQEKNSETKTNELSLLTFKGTFKDKFIQVKWSPLATPQAIKVYLVQYSQDGKSFKTIKKVFPELANFYKYNSIIYHAGANYFRITQVNQDGSTLISPKINVMCGFADRYVLEIEQKKSIRKLMLQVRNDQKVEAEVLDEKGKVIQPLFSGEMMANEMIFRKIETADWQNGKYYISIRGENFRESHFIEVKHDSE